MIQLTVKQHRKYKETKTSLQFNQMTVNYQEMNKNVSSWIDLLLISLTFCKYCLANEVEKMWVEGGGWNGGRGGWQVGSKRLGIPIDGFLVLNSFHEQTVHDDWHFSRQAAVKMKDLCQPDNKKRKKERKKEKKKKKRNTASQYTADRLVDTSGLWFAPIIHRLSIKTWNLLIGLD